MTLRKANFKLKIKEKKTEEIKIDTEFIKLDSFLKFINAAQTGGHAKIIIADGLVKVNSEICTQRGKKIKPGDEVEFEKIIYRVI